MEATELRKNEKNDFKKDFFKLMINLFSFGKAMEDLRKHGDTKLLTTAR